MKTFITLSLLLVSSLSFAQQQGSHSEWSFKTIIKNYNKNNKLDTVSISAYGSGNNTYVIDPAKKRIDLSKTDDVTTMSENGAITFSVKNLGDVITVTTASGAKVSIINNDKVTTVYGAKGASIKLADRDKDVQVTVGKSDPVTVTRDALSSTLIRTDGTQIPFKPTDKVATVNYPNAGSAYLVNIGPVSPVTDQDGSHPVWVLNGNMSAIVYADGSFAVIIK